MRTAGLRSRSAARTRAGENPGGKILWLLRSGEEVIYNRLDCSPCDLPSWPLVKFTLPFARAMAKNLRVEDVRLPAAALSHRTHSFLKLVRYSRAATIRESMTLRRSEAA